MGRTFAHLSLTVTLVLVPALRVLCYDSCVPEPAAASVHAHETDTASSPECHEPDSGSQMPDEPESVPGPDDCTHRGDASAPGLRAPTKSAEGGGTGIPVTLDVVPVHDPFSLSLTDAHTPTAPITGQALGRFLTPLRI